MAQTLSRVLPASGRREPVRSSAAGTQAGMGGVSSTLRTPETQMFRCPRKRGNFKLWLANTVNEESGRSFDGANKMRSVSSRHGKSKLKKDVRCSRNNSLPGSETV